MAFYENVDISKSKLGQVVFEWSNFVSLLSIIVQDNEFGIQWFETFNKL